MTLLRPEQIILASASPRRHDLLAGLGVSFEVSAADIDETPHVAETPKALVTRLSASKARAVAISYPAALVIAADTVVVLDDEILGKPVDQAQNRDYIARLAGRSHTVYTGHALLYGGVADVTVKTSSVTFRTLSEAELDWYAATGEGLDKAGGYAIQGKGAALIPHIDGCYFNVMGLSVAATVEAATRLGVRLV